MRTSFQRIKPSAVSAIAEPPASASVANAKCTNSRSRKNAGEGKARAGRGRGGVQGQGSGDLEARIGWQSRGLGDGVAGVEVSRVDGMRLSCREGGRDPRL